MWITVTKTFGKVLSPSVTVIWILLVRMLNAIGLSLDLVFFPALRRQKIQRPIVIIGLPRSGTTFLQRFLVENGAGTGMRLWKMLFPSLVLQTILKPFLPLLEQLSPTKHHAAVAHKTGLMSVETDDPALLFRYFDGFFVYGFFLAWAENDMKDQFDPNQRDTSARDFRYLEEIWKRNLVGEHAEREIAKMFSLLPRIPQFLNAFPDARILYLVRDPTSTIPSVMSLLTGVLNKKFGFWKLDKTLRTRYIERLYNGLLDLSLRFHKDYTTGMIPSDHLLIIPYDQLMQEFETVMDNISKFADIPLSDRWLKTVRDTAEQQRAYKSRHQYSLSKFGLTKARIQRDFAPIYETFL